MNKPSLLSLALAVFLVWLTVQFLGCVQIIKEKDRLQINTLFKSVEFDRIAYDPNDGSLDISKYKGIPSDVEVVYDPKTGTFKFIAKGK